MSPGRMKRTNRQLVGVALRIGKSGEPACEVPALMHEREIKRNFAFAGQNFDGAIGAKAVLDFMNVGVGQGRRFRFSWWAPFPKIIPRVQINSVRSAAGACTLNSAAAFSMAAASILGLVCRAAFATFSRLMLEKSA